MDSDILKKKEKVRVFIILGPEMSATTVTKIKNSDGSFSYTGLLWDIWRNIRGKLEDKYDFQVLFSFLTENNLNNLVKDVYNEKYDIVINSFNFNNDREKLINFTVPFMIDGNSILYNKKKNITNEITAVFSSNAVKMILYGLITGCIIGFLLYYFDKSRYINLKNSIKINKSQYLLRTIVTGISSMLGQTGFLSENVSLNISNVVLLVFMLLISFVFIMFLQASITKTLIDNKATYFNRNNIKNYKLIGLDGSDVVAKIERYGVDIKTYKNKTTDELVNIYLNNIDKYDGVAMSYCMGFNYTIANHNLTLSDHFGKGFGYEPQSFIVSKKKIQLLEDVNLVINNMRYNLKLPGLCHKYFGNVNNVPVCKL